MQRIGRCLFAGVVLTTACFFATSAAAEKIVLVKGVAKSGTTAVQVCAGIIAKKLCAKAGREETCVTIKWPGKHTVPGLQDSFRTNDLTSDIERCFIYLRGNDWSNKAGGACSGMKRVQEPVIMAMRYPPATLVSWAHFAIREQGRTAEDVVATGYKATVKKMAVFYHWAKYFAPRALFVHQIDMFLNQKDTLHNMTAFIAKEIQGLSLSHSEIASVAYNAGEECSFDALKHQEQASGANQPAGQGVKYRTGEPMEFMTELNPRTLLEVEFFIKTHVQPELVQQFEDQGYFNVHEILESDKAKEKK